MISFQGPLEPKSCEPWQEVMMKRTALAVLMGAVLLASVISCASTPKETGATFLGDYAKNLQPGPKDGASERWLKPGVDFSKYNKIMLDHVVFFFADDSENKGIDTSELNEIANQCNLALVNALKESYPIVTEPGPDVVRIRFAITDLKQSRPVLSGVSSVLPVGLGISLVKKGATGSWTGSGVTKGAVMALDSMTDEVIAVARDDYSAKFTERFTKWGSVEEAFRFWGERLKQFIHDYSGILVR
jgi:hypothetical protein